MTDDEQGADTSVDTVFNPGQADWVKAEATGQLDEDQRALLLALAQLESEIGRDLSDDERSAIASLSDQLQGFDPSEIQHAIHQMVNRPADPDRQTSWSELKKRLG